MNNNKSVALNELYTLDTLRYNFIVYVNAKKDGSWNSKYKFEYWMEKVDWSLIEYPIYFYYVYIDPTGTTK